MTAKVVNYYRRNRYMKWFTSVVVVFAVIILSGKVFSLDGAERKIIYKEEAWNITDEFTKEWFFQDSPVSFEIDLSNDYSEAMDETILPFALTATFNESEIAASNITIRPIYIEVETPKEPEASDQDEHDESAGKRTGAENEEDAEAPDEEEAPEREDENDEQEVIVQQFTGKYAVEIAVPTNDSGEISDGSLEVSLEMLEDNEWGIPVFTSNFHVERDTQAPTISVTSPENLEGSYFDSKVTVKLAVEDVNYAAEYVDIQVMKDGEQQSNQWTVTEEAAKLTLTADFENEGDYELIVNARDKAGNQAPELRVPFFININGVNWSMSDSDGELVNGGFTKNDTIRLNVKNGISINEVKVAIYQDGELVDEVTENPRFFKKNINIDIPFANDGDYELRTTVKEVGRNGKTYVLDPFFLTVDTTKPDLIVHGVQDGRAYNTLPELKISVADANLESAQPAVIHVTKNGKDFLNTEDFQLTETSDHSVFYTYAFSEDDFHDAVYEIVAEAVDKAGNQRKIEPDPLTFTIDRTNPQITITGVKNNSYYNTPTAYVTVEDFTLVPEAVNIIVSVKDGEQWKVVDADIPLEMDGESKMTGEYTFEKDGVYRLVVEAADKAGNRESQTVVFINDTKAPQLSVDGVENGKEYRKHLIGSDQVTIRVKDENLDLEKTVLTVTKTDINGKTTKLNLEPLELINDREATNSYPFNEDGRYVIKLESTDKAGNKAVHETMAFTLDTVSPVIDISGARTDRHYRTNRDVVITVEDTTLDLDNTSIEVKRNGTGYSGKFKKESLSDTKAQFSHSFTEEGTYELVVKSQDRVKNQPTEKAMTFVVDKTAPEISLSGIANNGFVQKGNIRIEVKERYFETNSVEVRVEKDGKSYTDPRFDEWKNTGETSVLILPFDKTSGDGHYEVTVTAVDKAGNRTEAKRSFTIDNTKPKINISDVPRYNNENQRISVEVTETNFANNNVEVEVVQKHPVTKAVVRRYTEKWDNTGVKSRNHYTFDEDFEYTVHVSATDAAGNRADGESVTFTIDKVKPELRITGVEHGEHYKAKTVNFRVVDTTIDLSKTNLRVTRNGREYNIGSLKLQSGSRTSAALSHHFKEEGNYVLRFESTDKAGNKTVHEPIAFVIDSTNPVVNIDGVENSSFNPTDKTVTVSVDELNYETNDVVLQVTRDNQPYNMGQWRNTGKLSSLSHSFTQDGLYTINITATDKAGNGPVSQKVTFTIDKTNPEIEIIGVENDAYYNTDRPVQVNIIDTNLEVNRITVTRNGAAYNVGSFQINGNTATLQHTFRQEGVYVIEVEAIDKAGNTSTERVAFTIDKTPPEITPIMGADGRVIEDGEYINQIFTPNFVLAESEDTIVSVRLNGADVTGRIPAASKDMVYHYVVKAVDKAGNETTLNISFTLDITKPMLEITGVIDGFFNNDIAPVVTYFDRNLDNSRTSVTLNDETFINGTRLEKEKDYVLKAMITDLADNVSSRTIVFTVDKTAPVIRFVEPLSNLYFNTHVLPDFIIESLSPYEIIAMTLNGQPYTIGEPIEQEGLHVLYFELKDKAGNITQLSVEFVIDMTPPAVVYEGVESNGTYYEPVDLSIRLDNPNDTIQSVTINGELFNGETIEEDGNEILRTRLSTISEYEVVVTAFDEAGNETIYSLPFEIAEKSLLSKYLENTTLFAGTLVGLFAVLSAGISIGVRRRKSTRTAEETETEE
ncbi:Ig-like domain (group 3) [Evansella caseinilytica]|uniref:Ig-like domain (Group 3) n=1 Tax=Evansella caseinilytica TaxID=1503961 RepID=A0A1H3RXB2_9BACI|nr:Ig-like domain repeat protein [Evansella caseinilytica]SDZ30346.1 Ig-like domain (group 3) [Evansella caseinilytica]